ncbi:MAG TPA: hypothetical protein VFR88_06410, partial [Microlunatus sp.]|nr:hypothetical protein [Microlunatus sp.]
DAPKTAFAQHGLEAPTAHAVLTEDDIATPDGLPTAPTPQQVLAAAVQHGVSILIDPSAQPAGQGDVPLAAALAAGTTIDSAVIEFDHYAGDIFDGIAASYNYLTSLEN